MAETRVDAEVSLLESRSNLLLAIAGYEALLPSGTDADSR